MRGLGAADGRAEPARKRRGAIELPTVPPPRPPETRLCGDKTCLPIVSVPGDFRAVAESLQQTLHELADLVDSQIDGDYALHLFERLRMVYFGLTNQQWFHEWPVKKTT